MSGNAKTEEKKVNVQTEKFICSACGGLMQFDAKRNVFRCSSCGSEAQLKLTNETITEYSFDEYQAREAKSIPFEGIAVAHCQNCGDEITFDKTETAKVCPMCGSTQIAEIKQKAGIPPEGLIPFRFDRKDAEESFRKWAKSRWFAPNDFKKLFGEGKLSGVFVPFWTFDANASCTYLGRGGRTRVTRNAKGETQTVVDWYITSGIVSTSFDDIQICASQKSRDGIVKNLTPFNTVKGLLPYSSQYLAGYRAELYDIKADVAFVDAKAYMETALRSLASSDILRSYDRAEVNSISPTYSNVTYKHVLLPVWTSAFGYKSKTYQYAVNADTGAVFGERPYSIPKIAAAVIAGIVLVGALLMLMNEPSGGSETEYAVAAQSYTQSETMEQNDTVQIIDV